MPSYLTTGLLSKLDHLQTAVGDAPVVDADPCGCPPAGGVDLERTRFFPRQPVGPDDFTTDQRYFRAKLRRHNRLLHGWGVVCGACVERDPEHDCAVIVTPGYVLGPWGDEILIPHRVRVDLCTQDLHGDAVSPCGAGVDPWCSDVRVDRRDDEPLYIAIKHAECDSRPVRVSGCGCGCDDTECEYSRTRDSYAIRVLTELPSSHAELSPAGSLMGLLAGVTCIGGKGRPCPPCPAEPWVVLADVTLSGGAVKDVDCFSHRRYVASAAMFYFQCGGRGGTDVVDKTKKASLVDLKAMQQQAAAGGPPPSTVAVRLGGEWTSVPAAFEVQEHDTVRTLLEREGDRELLDPDTGDVIRLRELYDAAGVDPETPLRSRNDALMVLEGRRLDVAGLRTVRDSLEELLGRAALQRLDDEGGGAVEAAGSLPAAELPAAAAEPQLARALEGISVGELAGQDRDAFLERATAEVPEQDRERVAGRAADAWTVARRVALLTQSWRDGPEHDAVA